MQCEIRPRRDGRSPTNEEPQLPPRGFVNQVCREWLVHEDGALAQRLQEEEIVQHYDKNRTDRKILQSDLKQAKDVQKEEETEAQKIQRMYEQMLLDQEEADARVALQLQEEESRKLHKQKHFEEEDEALARQLQVKEKKRLEKKKQEKKLEHERKQVERARTQLTPSDVDDLGSPGHSREELGSPSVDVATSPIDHEYSDLTDFCIKPEAGMHLEDVRHLQEEQDAELARLLQEQETKRTGYCDKDRLMAIEAQDRELARLLQEQERAKARRAKERARQKATQKHSEQPRTENGSNSPILLHHSDTESSSKHSSLDDRASEAPSVSRSTKRPIRPTELEVSVNHNQPGGSHDLIRHGREHRGGRTSSQSSTESAERVPSEKSSSTHHHHPQGNHASSARNMNIAMAIDPTYNRRVRGNPSVVNMTTPVATCSGGPDSGGSTPVLPSPVSIRTGTYHGDDGYYDSDEGPAPPYMPIQGQKRNASLEKKKKSKGSKDSCKQQ